MKRPAVCLLVMLGTTACAGDPTGSAKRELGPSYDVGGWTIGSGKADTSTSNYTSTATSDTCTTERGGGWTIGSGFTQPLDPCLGQ